MKKCTNCGQTSSDDTKFCSTCGGGNFESVADTNGNEQQPAYQQQPYQQPSYQQQPAYQQQPYQQQPYQQQPYQQPAYQQPAYQQPYVNNTEPAEIKDFIIFFLLMLIPIFNLVYMIIVAVGGPKYNVSLTNFVRAAIIWGLIVGAISIIISLVASVSLFSIFRSNGYYGF